MVIEAEPHAAYAFSGCRSDGRGTRLGRFTRKAIVLRASVDAPEQRHDHNPYENSSHYPTLLQTNYVGQAAAWPTK